MKLLELPTDTNFIINGREGNRVGYWCPGCNKAIPIRENEIKWTYNQFANGIHTCGCSVNSIWEK